MHGKSLLHGATGSPGFLAMITPTPPAAITYDDAIDTTILGCNDVKHRTTFPATNLGLRDSEWQKLQMGYSNIKICLV